MSKRTADFTDSEITDYSKKHIAYEIGMLIGCADLMRLKIEIGNRLLDWTLHNCPAQSFAIHTRNLIDFLYPRPRKKPSKTDVTATAFLAPGAALRPMSAVLHNARCRADKEVAHLTISRRDDDDPEKQWAFSLLPEIFQVLNEFVDAALTTKLDPAVRQVVWEGAQKWIQWQGEQQKRAAGLSD